VCFYIYILYIDIYKTDCLISDRRDVKCRTKNKFARLRNNFRCSLTDYGPLAEYVNVNRATSLGQVRVRKIRTYRLETTT